MAKMALLMAAGAALLVQSAQHARGDAAADSSSQTTVSHAGVFHVAIFRFTDEHVGEVTAAFRELASAARREAGNAGYDVYRGKDDPKEFYIVEHWASADALSAHEHSDAFIRLGQGVLEKYATLHDTTTALPFDVAKSSPISR